jgi:CheY-like chemotaxis protein
MGQFLRLRVLIVDDLETDAKLLAYHLRKGGYEVYYERVESVEAMRQSLARGSFDTVFCDFVLLGLPAPCRGSRVPSGAGFGVPGRALPRLKRRLRARATAKTLRRKPTLPSLQLMDAIA